MSKNPETPTKADDKFEDIVYRLNIEWGLQLPTSDDEMPWSPSCAGKTTDKGTILRKMRFLYYRHRKALDDSVTCFKEEAGTIFSDWKFKPRADLNVIPSCASSKSAVPNTSFLKKRDLDEPAAVLEVTARLLHILTNVVESVTTGKEHGTDSKSLGVISQGLPPNIPDVEATKFTEISYETKLPKPKSSKASQQSTLSKFGFGIRETVVKPDPPSSDEYKCDQATTAILEDFSFASTSLFDNAQSGKVYRPNVKPEYSRRSTESSKTAPSTPILSYADVREPVTKASEHESNFGLGKSLAQNTSIVTSGLRNVPRKRSHPESAPRPMPHKVSREGTMRQVSGSGHSFFQAGGVSNTAQSFESVTSVPSSMASNSTTQTTPNTSFTADSMATSFSSNVDSFSKGSTSFMTDICLDFQAKLSNSDTHQAPSDEMNIDLDSLSHSSITHRGFNNAKVADKSMGPPTLFGKSNTCGARAPVYEALEGEMTEVVGSVEQKSIGKSTSIEYLDKALLSKSPFGTCLITNSDNNY